MNIAACQVEDIRNDIPRALSIVASSVARGEAEGADLICFPEAFLQGYEVTADHVTEVAIDLSSAGFARALRTLSGFRPTIVLGLIEREGDRFFNTAIAIARGRIVARYHKVRLLESEQLIFTPGSSATVFEVAGVSVGLNICYDLNFPEVELPLQRPGPPCSPPPATTCSAGRTPSCGRIGTAGSAASGPRSRPCGSSHRT